MWTHLFQICWITPTEAPPVMNCKGQCHNENAPFNGTCPKPGLCSRQCAALRFKQKYGECEGDRVYHCARNFTDINLIDWTQPRGFAYIEACAREVLCRGTFFKDARSLSWFTYNRSQILQYVEYTKCINIAKRI